jgi:hypothetical protein
VYCAVNRLGAAVANRTVKGCFVKGESGNPRGRPKATTERRWEARARREVYRQVASPPEHFSSVVFGAADAADPLVTSSSAVMLAEIENTFA